MKVHRLAQEQILPVSLSEAWGFFSNPRNLDEITPDDLGFHIESCEEGPMFEGQIITYRSKLERIFSHRRGILAERFGEVRGETSISPAARATE